MSSNPRPAKRQRRSTVVYSDEEGETTSSSSVLRLKRSHDVSKTRASVNINALESSQQRKESKSVSARSTPAKSSPKSSPEKSRKSKKLSLDESKNKSLHTFFNKVSEEERWRKRSATPEAQNIRNDVEDDIIDDDESMDEALAEAIRRSEQDMVKQEPSNPSLKSIPLSSRAKPFATSSQRFRKPVLPNPSVGDVDASLLSSESAEDSPWADKYGPSSLEELAVHKKKVQEVQKWLGDVLLGRVRQRILVLKGPAGSGKSTTVRLLSQTERLQVVSWRNPDTAEPGTLSSSLQFAEFITRGGDYNALSLSEAGGVPQSGLTGSRLLLIEDFPASLTRSSNAVESFRSVLLHAAANSGSWSGGARHFDPGRLPPIVLVISETLVSSSTAFADSFTAQRLLGPELVHHPGVSVIEFNPVATTFLSKALDLVIKKEARDSRRRRIPGPAVLQRLAEMGDIRNAVNSLQFLCTRGDESSDWSGTVAANSKRGGKSSGRLSEMEENSLKLISSRETTLDMFHAAGKVCYNKREDSKIIDADAPPPVKPPHHLIHLHRPKVSLVDIEGLLNETGTDIQTFVSTVHQNYVLSCNHDDFVDFFDGCASVLSDAELLDPDGRFVGRSRARANATRNTFQFGATDSLRQDEIGFQVATRGVLFNLPCPVSRATPPGGGRGTAFKMYYPASLRLWRPTEETNGLLELAVGRISGQDGSRRSQTSDPDGVASWQVRATAFETNPVQAADEADTSKPHLDLSKENLVLEILPYMSRILDARGEDATVLKKITQLRGFNTAIEEEPDEEAPNDDVPGAARLSRKVEAVHKTLEAQRARQTAKRQSETILPVEKLYIEDDDIEDD